MTQGTRVTRRQVVDLLRERVEKAGGQMAFGREHGISQGYVNDVLKGRYAPGPKLLKALGVERAEEEFVVVESRGA